MGRTSKLSQDAWAQIERRLAGGAGVRMLAREYGVDASAISRRFSQQTQQVRDLARRLADVQNDVAALPVQQQHLVLQLVDELRQITGDLTRAARTGAATARHLSERAYRQVQKIDHHAPLTATSMATLEGASALTRCANEAAATGLTMLKLFQAPTREAESIRKAEEPKVTRIELVPMQAHPVVASNTGT